MHGDRPPGLTTGDRLRGPVRIEMAIAEVRPPTPDRHHREVDRAGRRPPRHLVHGVVEIGVTGQPYRAAAVTDQVTHRRGPGTPPPPAVVAGRHGGHGDTARRIVSSPADSSATTWQPCLRSQAAPPGGDTTGDPRSRDSVGRSVWSWCMCDSTTRSAESHGPTGNRPPMRRTMPTLPTWLNTGSLSTRTPASSTSTQEWPSHVAWRRPVTGAGGVRSASTRTTVRRTSPVPQPARHGCRSRRRPHPRPPRRGPRRAQRTAGVRSR